MRTGRRCSLRFTPASNFRRAITAACFLREHGSWNRSQRAGYQVVFIPFKDGKPSGDPQPFMTGLVPDPTKGNVNGRPVGVTVAPDGSLLVSDDGAQVGLSDFGGEVAEIEKSFVVWRGASRAPRFFVHS